MSSAPRPRAQDAHDDEAAQVSVARGPERGRRRAAGLGEGEGGRVDASMRLELTGAALMDGKKT